MLQVIITDVQNQFAEANRFLEEGRFKEAIDRYVKLKRCLPITQRKQLQAHLVIAYYKAGMDFQALTQLHKLKPAEHSDDAKRLLVFFERHAGEFFGKAMEFFRNENYPHALKLYESLHKLNFFKHLSLQDSNIVIARIAYCHYKLHNFEQTVSQLDQLPIKIETSEMSALLQPMLDDVELQLFRANKHFDEKNFLIAARVYGQLKDHHLSACSNDNRDLILARLAYSHYKIANFRAAREYCHISRQTNPAMATDLSELLLEIEGNMSMSTSK